MTRSRLASLRGRSECATSADAHGVAAHSRMRPKLRLYGPNGGHPRLAAEAHLQRPRHLIAHPKPVAAALVLPTPIEDRQRHRSGTLRPAGWRFSLLAVLGAGMRALLLVPLSRSADSVAGSAPRRADCANAVALPLRAASNWQALTVEFASRRAPVVALLANDGGIDANCPPRPVTSPQRSSRGRVN